jgi:hypothetical protein
VYEAFLAALAPDDRVIVRDTLPTQWHPEELHARVLQATFEVLAKRDINRYERIIGDCTLLGVKTFARLVLSMSSPEFVLRRTPTLWSVLRRGPATLTVEQSGTLSVLRYRSFPFFADPLYRHYFRALLGALVRPALGRTPKVRLADHGDDSLDVEIDVA